MTTSGPDTGAALETAASELEDAARRLRDGGLGTEEAAALVERCADLAARLGRELEHAARVATEPVSSGQETLL